MKIMIAALMGLRSDIYSEKFICLFPYDLVNYLDASSLSDKNDFSKNESEDDMQAKEDWIAPEGLGLDDDF